MAVRQAIGANSWHIASEALYESLTIALAGSILGIGIGAIGIRLLGTIGAGELPLGATIALDGRVSIAASVAALIVGVALAFPIIWHHLHGSLVTSLQAESRSGLFETEPFHLGSILGAALVISLISQVAFYLPSQRATRVSPMEALL